MSDNILQTLQHLVQDVIAPDVRELKANQSAFEKQLDAMEKHMEYRFQAADQKADARFEALMSAISESRAQAELSGIRAITALSERVAILESKRN